MNLTKQPSGWLATCACGWERYEQRRPILDAQVSKHTCSKPKRHRDTATPKRSGAATWDAREESTWIDKL